MKEKRGDGPEWTMDLENSSSASPELKWAKFKRSFYFTLNHRDVSTPDQFHTIDPSQRARNLNWLKYYQSVNIDSDLDLDL